MQDKIYVIGHKSPDLDTVTAAISYANLKNKLENKDIYTPAVPGEINRATVFALDKFGFNKPELLENAAGKKLILVDHNEFAQAVDGIKEAEIVEILDHHKMDFKYSEPISITVRPWGSSNSIIYYMYKTHKVDLDEKLAGLMLSAVLDDTVITKSPTCTEKDKEIINELSGLAGIEDWQALGVEIFKAKSAIKEAAALDIIKGDFKDFNFSGKKFGIGQVETVDLEEITPREDELLEEMRKLKESENYHSVILPITDILKEGSQVLIVSDDEEGVAKALNTSFDNQRSFIQGLISRKKQVVPPLTEAFDK